jgi:hypothetical protein
MQSSVSAPKNLVLNRVKRRKADALAAEKEIARSRICLKLYLVKQRRKKQSALQDVIRIGIKKQNL